MQLLMMLQNAEFSAIGNPNKNMKVLIFFICFYPLKLKNQLLKASWHKEFYRVTGTVYHTTRKQCDETPLVTADGSRINPLNPQRWVALSRDMFVYFTFGDTVEVFNAGPCSGTWVVRDCMAKRWTKSVDFLVKSGTGKWDNILINEK